MFNMEKNFFEAGRLKNWETPSISIYLKMLLQEKNYSKKNPASQNICNFSQEIVSSNKGFQSDTVIHELP